MRVAVGVMVGLAVKVAVIVLVGRMVAVDVGITSPIPSRTELGAQPASIIRLISMNINRLIIIT